MAENSGNRPVGRPRAFPEADLEDSTGHRQAQDRAYARLAVERADEDIGDWPVCVLAQLGRFQDPDLFLKATRWYESKPADLTARQAVTVLNQWRSVDPPSRCGDYAELRRLLVAVIDDYRLRHPDIDQDEVAEAIKSTLRVVLETWAFSLLDL